MAIEISGRNYEVTDRIRDLIDKKLSKVMKYFDDVIDVRCVLNVEKYRNICEIMIIGRNYDLKSAQEAESMEDAINSTVDHLKRQAQKNHTKVKDRKRKGTATPESWTVQVFAPDTFAGAAKKGNGSERSRPKVIRTADLPIRPMSVEHAALLLDDSKNEFIVFQDVDTEKVTVLYKRRDDSFGMIAPEF